MKDIANRELLAGALAAYQHEFPRTKTRMAEIRARIVGRSQQPA
jgi:hypothetical protein